MIIKIQMNKITVKIISFLKGLILVLKPHIILGWLRRPLLKISNMLSLTRWVSEQTGNNLINDFYTCRRDYTKRYQLYKAVSEELKLKNEAVVYLEFGVSGGHSLRWWLNECISQDSRFIGFDTFEGLPEAWGGFNKGDMLAEIPDFNDSRVELVKGLFQVSVRNYLMNNQIETDKRKIIHFDADLFSSTLFALSSIAVYLNKGDILFFDEFNVPDHEFFAFRIFTESWYIKTKLIGAVNNYLQTAFMVV